MYKLLKSVKTLRQLQLRLRLRLRIIGSTGFDATPTGIKAKVP